MKKFNLIQISKKPFNKEQLMKIRGGACTSICTCTCQVQSESCTNINNSLPKPTANDLEEYGG